MSERETNRFPNVHIFWVSIFIVVGVIVLILGHISDDEILSQVYAIVGGGFAALSAILLVLQGNQLDSMSRPRVLILISGILIMVIIGFVLLNILRMWAYGYPSDMGSDAPQFVITLLTFFIVLGVLTEAIILSMKNLYLRRSSRGEESIVT